MLIHGDLTEKIIGGFYRAYNELGFGFLEKVYERSLILELQDLGLACIAQCPIKVFYKGLCSVVIVVIWLLKAKSLWK